MKKIERLAKDLYSSCLTATGAYRVLKSLDADKHLPGYDHCLSRLKDVIKRYQEWEDK
jgi:hypothetical protein